MERRTASIITGLVGLAIIIIIVVVLAVTLTAHHQQPAGSKRIHLTEDGTYTPSSNTLTIEIEMVGPGGKSGTGNRVIPLFAQTSGGGGGGYIKFAIAKSDFPGTSAEVKIGKSVDTSDVIQSTTVTFSNGQKVYANGGGLGVIVGVGDSGPGGAGGKAGANVPGGQFVTVDGLPGGQATSPYIMPSPGAGGDSYLGAGGKINVTPATPGGGSSGGDGKPYGGGGGGGQNPSSDPDITGGLGGQGTCYITEFY